MKRKTFVAILLAAVSIPAFAAERWREREICRVATKVYFFLSDTPADAPDSGQYMGFQSARNNYYTCRVDGNIADLRWINKSGQQMESRSTTFEIRGAALTVKSEMKTETFLLE